MNDSVIQPIGSNVLLQVGQQVTEKTAAGIFLPANAKGRERFATVLAVGPKADIPVRIGDVVMFDPYRVRAVLAEGSLANAAGTPVASPGDRFIIEAENIQAVSVDAPIVEAELRHALLTLRRHIEARELKSMDHRDLMAAVDLLEGDLAPHTPDCDLDEDCACE